GVGGKGPASRGERGPKARCPTRNPRKTSADPHPFVSPAGPPRRHKHPNNGPSRARRDAHHLDTGTFKGLHRPYIGQSPHPAGAQDQMHTTSSHARSPPVASSEVSAGSTRS